MTDPRMYMVSQDGEFDSVVGGQGYFGNPDPQTKL